MKKKYLTLGVALVLAVSMVSTSCIGSFALTNKLLSWNKQVGNKFVNELVFFAFWILPVYEVAGLADILVINSIEFWSGSNPMASSHKIIEGENGRYMVDCDETGYTITSEADGSVVRLDYHSDSDSWSVNVNDTDYTFLTFIDDTHVALPDANGGTKIVELSETGTYAYKQMAARNCMMALQ